MVQGNRSSLELASAGDFSRPKTATAFTTRLVEKADYREAHLEGNNIYFLDPEGDEHVIPKWVSDACDEILNPPYLGQPLSAKAVSDLKQWHFRDAPSESEVNDWFSRHVFPTVDDANAIGMGLIKGNPFTRLYVPGGSADNPVSEPRPDLAYGCSLDCRWSRFSEAQQLAGKGMDPPMGKVNLHKLAFPFFVVECKVEGPNKGSLKVGESQCAGASATCVSMIDRLNKQLEGYPEAQKVGNTVFCAVVNQDEARVLASWMEMEKDESGEDMDVYYLREISSLWMNKAADRVELCRLVTNIMDWARGSRLDEIKEALDLLGEQERKEKSAGAKQMDTSPGSGDTKRRRTNKKT